MYSEFFLLFIKSFPKWHASTELDNLLKISTFVTHADDINSHHPEVINGFDYYLTIFKYRDSFYSGIINIKNTGKGQVEYDISRIKALAKHEDLTKIFLKGLAKAYKESIDQDALKYKSANEKGQEKISKKQRLSKRVDSVGRQLSEQQQKYFADSKVVDSEGRLKPMYHG